jgi:hypothetical protein
VHGYNESSKYSDACSIPSVRRCVSCRVSLALLEQSVQADKGGIPNAHASDKARGHEHL